jgi:hypothetical protein
MIDIGTIQPNKPITAPLEPTFFSFRISYPPTKKEEHRSLKQMSLLFSKQDR